MEKPVIVLSYRYGIVDMDVTDRKAYSKDEVVELKRILTDLKTQTLKNKTRTIEAPILDDSEEKEMRALNLEQEQYLRR